jgi:hypothetical protein
MVMQAGHDHGIHFLPVVGAGLAASSLTTSPDVREVMPSRPGNQMHPGRPQCAYLSEATAQTVPASDTTAPWTEAEQTLLQHHAQAVTEPKLTPGRGGSEFMLRPSPSCLCASQADRGKLPMAKPVRFGAGTVKRFGLLA